MHAPEEIPRSHLDVLPCSIAEGGARPRRSRRNVIHFVANHQLCALAMDDVIWKSVFLRDVGHLSMDIKPAFSWMSVYLTACDESHTLSHFETEGHIGQCASFCPFHAK